MANLQLSRLILKDNWPGEAEDIGIPQDGFDNTRDNFSTADETGRALNVNHTQRLGAKRKSYTDNTNCPGWYIMMYLCLHSFEDGMDISVDFSDGNCFHTTSDETAAATAEFADAGKVPYCVVSRCTTGADPSKSNAVALFCSTNTYSDGTVVLSQGYGDGYGWAWVGGVCPAKDITIFDDGSGNFQGVDLTVDAGVGKGPVYLDQTGAAALMMATDLSNINDATLGSNGRFGEIGWVCDSAA